MEVIFTIKYHPLVVHDDIPTLDKVWRSHIKKTIELKLSTAPDLFGLPLRRSLKGHRKLRVGNYRIIFRISESTVLILAILHRSVVYQRVPRRIE